MGATAVAAGDDVNQHPATVLEGRIGFSVASPDVTELISSEDRRAISGRARFEVRLDLPPPGAWLVVHNAAAGGVVSKVPIHGMRAYAAPATAVKVAAPASDFRDNRPPDGFVPLEELARARSSLI